MRRRTALASMVTLTAAIAGVAASSAVNAGDVERSFQPRRLLPPQAPISNFPIVEVRKARNLLNPSELVLGVTLGNQSRAYPINMLTGPQREILNDNLGGAAIAATW